MGNNLSSSSQKGKRRTLLTSLSSGDASAISAVISTNTDLFACKVDTATGNNIIHAAVVLSNHAARPLALLMSAVSAG